MPDKGSNKSCFDSVLAHLSDHGVIVCKACRFAVQPRALPSHLLRHQIYRAERRQLLQRCSKLNLREPEDVVNPPADAKPLPYLSVQKGFRCDAGFCDHACVSSKRMSQHWSEFHNEPDSRNVQARPVYLQTFFRGNKIKYFVVNGPGIEQLESNDIDKKKPPTARPTTSQAGTSPSINLLTVPAELTSISWDAPSSSSHSSPSSPSPCPPRRHDPDAPPIPLDLDTLQYFHQYMHTTCLTLRRGATESPSFWRVDIVGEAFRYRFLMYGILGVAAAHLTMPHVVDIDDAAALRRLERHRTASLRYQHAALVDFRSAMREPDTRNSTALIAFGRVIGVQTAVHHQLNYRYPHLIAAAGGAAGTSGVEGRGGGGGSGDTGPDGDPNSLARVLEVFHLLRGVGEMLLAFQPLLPHGSDFLLSEEVLEGLRDQSPEPAPGVDSATPESVAAAAAAASPKFGSMTLEELAGLPVCGIQELLVLRERLAPLLMGSAGAVDAAGWGELEAAIERLKVAYARSFAVACSPSDEPDASWAKWNGAEGWLRRASEYFVHLLSTEDPAALVIFAHWCPLLKRLEDEYWFIRGQAGMLVDIVIAHLPGEGWAALVRGLV